MAENTEQAEKTLKEIPGDGGDSFLGFLRYSRSCVDYFMKERAKHGENVFRIDLGVSVIALVDHEAIKYVCDPELVVKETGFGSIAVNMDITNEFRPSMIANGVEHDTKKKLLIAMFERYLQPNLLAVATYIITEEFITNEKSWIDDFETYVLHTMGRIYSTATLGTELDTKQMKDYFEQLLVMRDGVFPCPCLPSSGSADFSMLSQAIAMSSTVRDEYFIQLCTDLGLTNKEEVESLLAYTLCFPVSAGTWPLVVTAVARCSCMAALKHELRDELAAAVEKYGALTEEFLASLKTMESFLYEVLRLHPPASQIIGKAKKDFVLTSNTGAYQIRKDELLFGSLIMAQRDGELFDEPETFQYDRFMDKSSRVNILSFHGPSAPTVQNHTCLGEDYAIKITKIFLTYLLLYCDWELAKYPSYSGNRTARFNMPDSEVFLKKFKANMPKDALRGPEESVKPGCSDEETENQQQEETIPAEPADDAIDDGSHVAQASTIEAEGQSRSPDEEAGEKQEDVGKDRGPDDSSEPAGISAITPAVQTLSKTEDDQRITTQ